jgi:hypothetical protein
VRDLSVSSAQLGLYGDRRARNRSSNACFGKAVSVKDMGSTPE